MHIFYEIYSRVKPNVSAKNTWTLLKYYFELNNPLLSYFHVKGLHLLHDIPAYIYNNRKGMDLFVEGLDWIHICHINIFIQFMNWTDLTANKKNVPKTH